MRILIQILEILTHSFPMHPFSNPCKEKGCIRNEWVIDPVFRAILKYKNHRSVIAIKEKTKFANFFFHEVNNEKIEKEIRRLNKNTAPHI